MQGFEKFEHHLGTQVPTVSCYVNPGRFSFNRAAVKKYGLEDKKYCDLYFDKKTQRIGFVFRYVPGVNSARVILYNNRLSVAGRAFSLHYGINLDAIKRREIVQVVDMLVVDASPYN